MVSKIIQKEKERQEGHLNDLNGTVKIIEHKQSLINLKEYMEDANKTRESLLLLSPNNEEIINNMSQVTEDIKELNIMIERYE